MIKTAKLIVRLTGDRHINRIIDLLPYDELAPFMRWYLDKENLDKWVLREETPTFLKEQDDEDGHKEDGEDEGGRRGEEQDQKGTEDETPAGDTDNGTGTAEVEKKDVPAEEQARRT